MAKNTKKSTTVGRTVKKSSPKKVQAKSAPVKPVVENQMPKTNLTTLGLFLVAAFVLASLFLFLRKNLIVATINGQPLTRLEVIKLLEKQNGKTVSDGLVSQILLKQESQKQKITVGREQIMAEIQKIEKQLKGQGSTLETALSAQGMMRKDLEEQIELRLILEKLLANKTKVTDKEVKSYIEANRSSYPEDLSDAELNKTVRQQLENQKLSVEAQKLLEGLKSKAKINYYVNY